MNGHLSGVWPVMLTPFGDDGTTDWSGLDALVEWYVSAGVAGLFAVCLSSEMYELTPEERVRLAKQEQEQKMAHYQVHTNVQSHFVKTGERILGAYGTSFWRSWVYPFYTPAGHTVVENSPFDHPFHNGIFVGQNPVKVADREGNFWGLPVKRNHDDPVATKKTGRMDPQGEPVAEVTDAGVRFTLRSIWRDDQEQPLLDEERTVILRALPDANVCDMTSRKTATYGAVEFPQTKFGSVCMRVEPRLLPALGGQVIGCLDGELRRGTADEVANTKGCDAVAYENAVPGLGVYGVCLIILGNSASPDRRGPWFIRDYGLATVNATRNAGIAVPAGGVWTIALRVIAYEGPITSDRLAVWQA